MKKGGFYQRLNTSMSMKGKNLCEKCVKSEKANIMKIVQKDEIWQKCTRSLYPSIGFASSCFNYDDVMTMKPRNKCLPFMYLQLWDCVQMQMNISLAMASLNLIFRVKNKARPAKQMFVATATNGVKEVEAPLLICTLLFSLPRTRRLWPSTGLSWKFGKSNGDSEK